MTVQFIGYITNVGVARGDQLRVEVALEAAKCDSAKIAFAVPKSDAAHWVPGSTVQFTAYTLPSAVEWKPE